jgi:hypothetical protein
VSIRDNTSSRGSTQNGLGAAVATFCVAKGPHTEPKPTQNGSGAGVTPFCVAKGPHTEPKSTQKVSGAAPPWQLTQELLSQ